MEDLTRPKELKVPFKFRQDQDLQALQRRPSFA